MTSHNRATLNSNADATIQDNTIGDITAAEVRAMIKDLADSTYNKNDEVVLEAGKQTLLMQAMAWRPKTTLAPEWTSIDGVDTWEHSGTAITRLRCVVPFPKGWNEGTVSFKVYAISYGTATQVISWKMAAKAYSNDDPVWTSTDLSTGVQEALMTITVSGDVIVSAESAAITIDSTPAEGDLILFELWRDPTDADDTSTVAAFMVATHIYYTVNAGSDA